MKTLSRMNWIISTIAIAMVLFLSPTRASAQAASGASLPGNLPVPTNALSAAAYCPAGGSAQTVGNTATVPFVAVANYADQVSGNLYNTSAQVALTLLKGFGTLEFLWFMYSTIYKHKSITDMLASVFFKLITLTVLLSIIVYFGSDQGKFIKGIVFGFFGDLATQTTGAAGTSSAFGGGQQKIIVSFGGAEANTPSTSVSAPLQNIGQEATCDLYLVLHYDADMYSQQIIGTNVNPISALGEKINGAVGTIAAIFAAAGIIALFGMLEIMMLIIVIDGSLMLGAGIFLLGFSGSRWTSGMGNSYWSYVIALGFKVFAIQFIAGIVTSFLQQTVIAAVGPANGHQSESMDPMASVTILLAVFVGFAMLLNVNKIAEMFAKGTPSFGVVGGMVETAIAGAVVAVGAGAAAMGAGAGAGAIGAGGATAAGGAEGTAGASAALSDKAASAASTGGPPPKDVAAPAMESTTSTPSASEAAQAVTPGAVNTGGGLDSGPHTGTAGLSGAGSGSGGNANNSNSGQSSTTPTNGSAKTSSSASGSKASSGASQGSRGSSNGAASGGASANGTTGSANVSPADAQGALSSGESSSGAAEQEIASEGAAEEQSAVQRGSEAVQSGAASSGAPGSSSQSSEGQAAGQSTSGLSTDTDNAFTQKRSGRAASIRQAASLASHVFHSNPMQIDTAEDAKDTGYQIKKAAASLIKPAIQGAFDHTGGAGHGFQAPKFHGEE